MGSLEEWGLAGRSFGTWVTWFLIGGDLYTAYTVIAVPAALYGAGAMGFFALPYAVLAYPYMMVVLPRMWTVCHRHGYVTFADFVGGRYGNRWLTVAIAATGVLALMPYIALQLVGIRVVIAALGVQGEWPLAAAFVVLGCLHLFEWVAGSGGDRDCEGCDVVRDGDRGGGDFADSAGWLCAGVSAGERGAGEAYSGGYGDVAAIAVSGVLDAGGGVGDCADAVSAYGNGGAERGECAGG